MVLHSNWLGGEHDRDKTTEYFFQQLFQNTFPRTKPETADKEILPQKPTPPEDEDLRKKENDFAKFSN